VRRYVFLLWRGYEANEEFGVFCLENKLSGQFVTEAFTFKINT
jgi:hypothetical protein